MVSSRLVRPYCLFYKGEIISPFNDYDDNETLETDLWKIEYQLCENMYDIIDEKNPKESMASFVYAMLQKWYPWSADDAMLVYLQKCPELKSKFF
jgi:hypothetical protein